jgi:hypothetical protein
MDPLARQLFRLANRSVKLAGVVSFKWIMVELRFLDMKGATNTVAPEALAFPIVASRSVTS